MGDFGMGIALNFKDNATSGIKGAIDTLNGLSEAVQNASEKIENMANISTSQFMISAGQAMSDIGNIAVGAGNKISGMLQGFVSQVLDAGKKVAGFERTLTMLFGSAQGGKEAFQWVKDYAMTSSFNFTDLMEAMTMMKAVGIDVRKDLVSSTGKAQNLLKYAGDLAAVFPQMRNMYGTGIQAAMGALKEYIAEGNAMSLQRGAGLDIKGILGEAKGADIATRSRQVADLIEKIGALGMTKAIEGTATQRLSNIEDIWFSLLTEISNSGIFDTYQKTVKVFTDAIFAIKNSDIKAVGKSIGEALMFVMKPAEAFASAFSKVLPVIVEFVKQNPALLKTVVAIMALGSAALVTGGSVLVLIGMFSMLIGTISGLPLYIKRLPQALALVTSGIRTVIFALSRFALAGFILYKSYQKNLFGIRTLFGKLMLIIEAVSFMLSNNNTLTKEMYDNLHKQGLLPIVEDIIMLKEYLSEFFTGVYEGFTSAVNGMMDFITAFSEATGIDMSNLLENLHAVVAFFTNFGKGDAESIKEIRDTFRSIGDFLGTYIVPLLAVFNGLVISVFKSLAKIPLFFFRAFGGNLLVRGMAMLGKAIFTFLIFTFGTIPTLVGLTMAGIALIIYSYWDDIVAWSIEKWTSFTDWIYEGFNEVWQSIDSLIQTVIGNAVDNFNKVLEVVRGIRDTIASWDTKKADEVMGRARVEGITDEYGNNYTYQEGVGFTRFASGGEIGNTQGLAYLDPNEVVVNGELTKALREFLLSNKTQSSPSGGTVVFENGSIVINLTGSGSSADLDNIADRLMSIIQRKMQLQGMSIRMT